MAFEIGILDSGNWEDQNPVSNLKTGEEIIIQSDCGPYQSRTGQGEYSTTVTAKRLSDGDIEYTRSTNIKYDITF